ncbi:MAG TPA: hypothetical protein VLV83_13225 [Acidobacteriota bacterium]|nr:hypothetical protein [Acidobacteriota bacterium]
MSKTLFWAAIAVLICAVIATPAVGQGCDCENSPSSICSGQGFRITLVAFEIDQDAGTSNWDYQVCNETGLGTGCDAPKDLSHIDLSLPGLGECLTASQQIVLSQLSGFDNALLACGVDDEDPSCDLFGDTGDFVAKCDIALGNLDPGECVTMRLSIAGEQPTLGAGAAMTVTKAGPECVGNCLLGPACESCIEDPQEEECMTRTPGFWGTHPAITSLFLPVTVCGEDLSTVAAGSCDSATEAMCVSGGRESRGNPVYAQLVRQLTAAKLNLAATAANGGECGDEIELLIAECEALCGANKKTISESGCVEALAAFNESLDTLGTTPPPFDRPGPAQPAQCREANGNGLVIGTGSCNN